MAWSDDAEAPCVDDGRLGRGPSVHMIRLCSGSWLATKWSFNNVWLKLVCISRPSASLARSPVILYKSVRRERCFFNITKKLGKRTFENRRSPQLDVNIGYFRCQLHGRRHHVHGFSGVAQRQENVTQKNQRARSQSVQILSVGHLQRFSQISPEINRMPFSADLHQTRNLLCVVVLGSKKCLETLNVISGRLQTVRLRW